MPSWILIALRAADELKFPVQIAREVFDIH